MWRCQVSLTERGLLRSSLAAYWMESPLLAERRRRGESSGGLGTGPRRLCSDARGEKWPILSYFPPRLTQTGGKYGLELGGASARRPRCGTRATGLREAGSPPYCTSVFAGPPWAFAGIRAGIRGHSRHISRGIRGHSRAFAAFALDCPCGESLETLGFRTFRPPRRGTKSSASSLLLKF